MVPLNATEESLYYTMAVIIWLLGVVMLLIAFKGVIAHCKFNKESCVHNQKETILDVSLKEKKRSPDL